MQKSKMNDAEIMTALDEAFDVSEFMNLGEESAPVMEEQIAKPVEEVAPVQAPVEKAVAQSQKSMSFVEKLRRINADNEARVNDLFAHIEQAAMYHNAKEFYLRPDTMPYMLRACQEAGFEVIKGEDKITLRW